VGGDHGGVACGADGWGGGCDVLGLRVLCLWCVWGVGEVVGGC
jgi:hypothetical protein